MSYTKWIRCAVAAGLLAGWTAACDFVDPISSDPNAIPNATIDQLFVGNQVQVFFLNGGELSRMAGVWHQQMAGTDRQWTDLDSYQALGEDSGNTEWNRVYRSGGLIDLRLAREKAVEQGDSVYLGILKIHEAFLIGTIASVWGDVIYSEFLAEGKTDCLAADGSDCPSLDSQADVYADVQQLLDEAIAELQDGSRADNELEDFDLNFGGDPVCWEQVAHSLKARYYMHWAEGDPANYTNALNEAQNGIQDFSCNWRQVHGSSVQNSNLWYQFQRDRSGYISAGQYLVELLDRDQDRAFDPAIDDDRLPLYYSDGIGSFDGQYIGSPPGEAADDPGPSASNLTYFRQATWGQPIITCWENSLIIAEAELSSGGSAANASAAMQNALDCQEAFWALEGETIDLGTAPDAATIDLDAVMTEKYIAQFLNIDTWNDYKRTCIPALTPAPGSTQIPGRLFYSLDERQANPNIPSASEQGPIPGTRNANDPSGC